VSTNHGNNWTAINSIGNWGAVSISSSGQYQTAVQFNGRIYVSTNYGNTWTVKGTNTNRLWHSVSMSSTGQYQTAVVHNGQIYVSTDYGNTWTAKDSSRSWRGVSVSSTGEYQVAAASGGDYVYVSYAVIVNPNLDFYLSQLDVLVDASSALLYGVDTVAFDGSANVAVTIPLENAMNIFQFYTDSTDINNLAVDDIQYKVVYTGAGTTRIQFDLDTSALLINGDIHPGAANRNTTYDYVRYLAQRLFNTHLGVDLFSNETELRTTLRDDFSTAFDSNMTALTTANGVSPAKSILLQVINNQPERLSDISTLSLGSDWYKSPLQAGDVLYFRLTVNAAANQNDLTGVGSIPPRVYLMQAILV